MVERLSGRVGTGEGMGGSVEKPGREDGKWRKQREAVFVNVSPVTFIASGSRCDEEDSQVSEAVLADHAGGCGLRPSGA